MATLRANLFPLGNISLEMAATLMFPYGNSGFREIWFSHLPPCKPWVYILAVLLPRGFQGKKPRLRILDEERRQERIPAARWSQLIAAVEEALRLGSRDAGAVLHILNMPDAEQRKRHAIALAADLAQFERPMPAMEEYDLLLTSAPGGIQ